MAGRVGVCPARLIEPYAPMLELGQLGQLRSLPSLWQKAKLLLLLKAPSPFFLLKISCPSSWMTRLPVTPGEYLLILALGKAVLTTLAA